MGLTLEMDGTALPFTTAGFVPLLPLCACGSAGASLSSGWEPGCVSSAGNPAFTLSFYPKSSPEGFKPALLVLLTNTGCKSIFLALLLERVRWYMDRKLKMRGDHIKLMFSASGGGGGQLEGLNRPGFESRGEKERKGEKDIKNEIKT